MTNNPLADNASFKKDLVAPCGMNCRLCWGFIRQKNTCPGCLRLSKSESAKSACRTTCKIRNCPQLANAKLTHCSEECAHYPCYRLKQLDKRYRSKYAMSMIDNLKNIEKNGLEAFVKSEQTRWACPQCGNTLCVHKADCLSCGYQWQ